MTKYFLLLFFFFCSFMVISQTLITLTFMGQDSVSQNFIPLDSVLVKNVSQNCDTLLYGPIPVLSLIATWPVGTDEMKGTSSGAFVLNQNYPNPFRGYTYVSIYREYSGPLNLMLFDGSGTRLAEYQDDFEKGFHSFVISTSGEKIMMLAVSDEKNHRSIKIVSNGQGNESNTIQYLGHTSDAGKSSLKNQDYSGFTFYLGNTLRYTAYANGYQEETIIDNPVTDSIYYFNMSMLALPSVTTFPATDITQTTATSGGNVTSDGGATVTVRGVCWSTSPNPTTADSYTTDGSGMGTFVSNLTGLLPNTPYYVRAYATNSVGTAYGNEITFATLYGFICGDSITIDHLVSGGVAPVDKTVTYGTVTNIPGEPSKCWITGNLGADHQAMGKDDATEASSGWYWQFNRKQGYKFADDGTRTPNSTWITYIYENLDWQPANDPCALELGGGWRIPTYTEWFNVDATGNWADWNDEWNSDLKMHGAGYLLNIAGTLSYRGVQGFYWSSTQYMDVIGWCLIFYSGYSDMNIYAAKAYGFSLRCLTE